ncbi:MAG TPA: YbaB/EbfC family nucleoid-associated protein [Candidatus Avimonas sp.]|nr:YbaB/EbfC family nucleoid-associated protein [Clostridiales bacterium]HPU58374.1 YbaB/EbfC family nucleoid-associated protein [Candidatus Avimonas sp.]
MKARLPEGFSNKGPGNMQSMLKQAKKLQEEMAALQEELDKREYTASSGGGAVTATVNGKHVITKLDIKPEVVDPDDVEMLSDLILAAVNEAIRQASENTENEMAKISGGLSFPGLF